MRTIVPLSSLTRRRFVTLLLALAGLILLAGGARAASEGRKTFTNSLKKMPASGVSAAAVTANADMSTAVEFHVALKMRDFPKLLARLATGERISQAEMAAKYYPLAADAKAVADWAASQGLSVLSTDPNNLGVHLRGTVAQVQTALRTSFAHVTFEGKDYTAAQTAPSLPASIATPVLGINGLQPYLHAQRHHTAITPVHPTPQIGNQPPYYIKEILHAYDADNVSTTGAGQKIAILIDTFPLDSDLTAFWQANSIPQSLANIEKVNVLDATLPGPEGEETLDVSWSSGIAPESQVRVYATSDLFFSDLDKGFQRIISDLPSQPELRILSISLGLGETLISQSEVTTESQYFATIANFGVSVFVSTGDDGSEPEGSDGAPTLQASYESTDPNVTAVGGTSLVLDPSSGDVASESAWSGSGGGESIYFSRPAYQAGLGVPAGTMRLVPDVASAADPNDGCYLVLNGEVKQIGGTSWSAPTWAGFAALINEARADNSLSSLGLLNPLIYPLIGTANFRDITTGSNGPAGSNTYNAGPGYDETTGIGVPDVGVLLQTLSSSGASATLSITGFTPTSGAPGTTVIIQGTQLDTVSQLTFAGTSAAFTANSPTQITATVPIGAVSGPITVVDTAGDTFTSTASFTVLPAASVNDLFVNATVISTATANISGSNVNATKEAGEPDHAGNQGGASVWYVWTAPTTGVFTLNTFGSNFDTLLAVYTGSAVGALTEVASNDDANTGVASSVTFNAVAGTIYHFAVDGFNDGSGPAEGNFMLNLAPSLSGPTITDFTPSSGNAGTNVIITGTNFTGTISVTFNGIAAAYSVDADTQITAVVPATATTGPIQITDGADRTVTSAQYFIVLPTPANDNFASAQPITGASAQLQGNNIGATKEPGEPDHAGNKGGASVWYVWTAPAAGVYTVNTFGSNFDTLLAVYTGATVDALTTIASDDDTGSVVASSVTFTAVAGTVYHFAVDGFNGDTGSIVLNFGASNSLPTLIAFTPASGGAGVTVTLTGTNFTGATAVEFNGTPATSFSVENSTRITVIVPADIATGPITVVTPNGSAVSTSAFTALPPPANDNFSNAQTLTGTAPLVVTGTNGGATKEPGEPNHAGNAGGRSVWYVWTAPDNNTYTITTRGSDFDTLLAVYLGGTVDTLAEVASNDDDPEGGSTSAVTFAAQGGKIYRIAVDGFDGEAGDITLSVLPAGSTTALYSTGFEVSEGFSSAVPLVGQEGWLARVGSGGNGVIIKNDGTQQAFIGYSAPAAGDTSLQVYYPINYAPSSTQNVVTFSSTVQIIGSTNGFSDQFGYTVYNRAGQQLFAVIFDNSTQSIYYQLDNGLGLVATGAAFNDEQVYGLQVTLDYANNVWSATLDGSTIVNGQPITTVGAALDLGDIDATWNLLDPSNPGDNRMLFDNYSVQAVTTQVPMITVQPASQTVAAGNNVSFSVVAAGSQPLVYQWYFNGTAITGATSPTFGITSVSAANAGAYTVRISNSFGTVTSAAATLTVTPGPVTPQTPVASVVVRNPTASSSTGVKALLVVSRTGNTTMPLTVNYTVKGSAQANVDYKPLTGTVTFKPGQATAKIKVKGIETSVTGTEPVKLKITLELGAGYILGDPSKGKVTILHMR